MSAKYILGAALCAATFTAASASPIRGYAQTNLVSDGAVPAVTIDPDLKNPWGISFGPTTPFWISDNATGKSTLYNGFGAKQGLVVTIPGAGGAQGVPTGQVFNEPGAAFGSGGVADRFLFAGEDGVISGWRGALGTNAEILFDNSGANAVYKGLALGMNGGNSYLYAADFHNNRIEVFPSSGAPALTGSFTDPTIPAGYAPFNIQNIGGELYVTYAQQDAAHHDDVPGPGKGFVRVFDTNGDFLRAFVSGGVLNAPWGLVMAPAGFGAAAGSLLIGNFGDGMINAFDSSGNLLGTLATLTGTPIMNDGLWGLAVGNASAGARANSVYITAGLNGESDGLFARIDAVPEPGTLTLLGAGLAFLVFRRRARA